MEMETPEKLRHEGHNVKRLREILGIKQETLAGMLGINQQKMSFLEQKERIDAEQMKEIAKALKVPVEAITNFSQDATVNFVANTYHDNSGNYNNFNPVDKIVELYERMLKEKDEIIEKLKAGNN